MLTVATKQVRNIFPELNDYICEAVNRLFPNMPRSEVLKIFPEINQLGIKFTSEKRVVDFCTKDLLLHIAFESQRYNLSKKERDDHGSFYTDPKELDTLFKKIKNEKVFTVLEAGCGAGTLIIQYLYTLKEHGYKYIPNIHGFDLNPKAITLASFLVKLALKDVLGKSFLTAFNKNILLQTKNIFDLDFTKQAKYDLVLMNPPYAKIGKQPNIANAGSMGMGNFTNLFIEYAFKKLEKDGQILFILGSPSKWGNSYSKINKHLLDNFKFVDFKEKLNGFVDINYDTFAFLAKESNGNVENKAQKLVNTLCFHVNKTELNILKKVEKTSAPITEMFSDVTRGAYIPKSQRKTARNNNFISSGANINSFTINNIDGYCAPTYWKSIFDQRRVILKAKRGKLLHSTICEKNIATTDNITNIVLANKNVSLEAVVTILNSSFMSFFAHTFVFCSETELARIIDKPYLEKFAAPKFMDKQLEKLSEIGKKIFMSTSNNSHWHYDLERDAKKISKVVSESKLNKLALEADEIIFDALGLSRDEREYILQRFTKVYYSLSSASKVAA